jgi:hypothetical protein
MNLAATLTRPLARLQEWLLPEPTLLVRQICDNLQRHPERFEVTGSPGNPARLYIVLRDPNDPDWRGMALSGERRICLQRDRITLESRGQDASELHWRDRARLQEAVKAWLLTP